MDFINEKECLNFLMTSEFESYDFSPDEMKYFLFEFRNFYRKEHNRNILLKRDIIAIEKENERLKREYNDMRDKYNKHLYIMDKKKKKKLTFKERLTGKIKM